MIVAAGDHVRLFRERLVSSAWLGLLVLPPVLTVVGVIVLPWTFGVDLRVGQPTDAMGQFFADNFQRRTGKPLPYVAGDPGLRRWWRWRRRAGRMSISTGRRSAARGPAPTICATTAAISAVAGRRHCR